MKQTDQPTLLFEDKPLFALDIGRSTVRVVQIAAEKHNQWRVIGYGQAEFPPEAITDGVITEHELLAQAVKTLFERELVGEITAHRVAFSLPASRAFSRIVELPTMTKDELAQTVRNEAEQYIPAAIDSLYIDHSITEVSEGKQSVSIVGIPRRIVDSYITLAKLLGIEPVLMQTSNTACSHLFSKDESSNSPTVLVDFGSDSTDITVYDNGPIVNGTVSTGGEGITTLIQKALGVTKHEADIVKARYGLSYSKKQRQLDEALTPALTLITREIKRTMRYYEERSERKQKITQVVFMGGGANMPGLSEYFAKSLELPVRAFDPSNFLDFNDLQPFPSNDRMSYVTALGLALYRPQELFND